MPFDADAAGTSRAVVVARCGCLLRPYIHWVQYYRCTRFVADLGVDDEISGNLASVVFSITGDGTVRYTSGTLTPSSPTTSVSIDVTGVDQLTLMVSDAGDGPGEDHAD